MTGTLLHSEVMIDLETMGLGPTAAIIQIGAVHFNADKVLHTFSCNVMLQSSIAYGMTTDKDTQDWWRGRHDDASAFRGVAHPLPEALGYFAGWLAGLPDFHEGGVWSKGPAFDAAVLEHACRLVGFGRPWHHRTVRDQRTIERTALALGWSRPQYPEPDHDALSDAIGQVEQVQDAWRFIKSKAES